LAGLEDGSVRCFDLRLSSMKSQAVITFECHDRLVSQVRTNPQAENVFLTGSYDGKVKMWDLRNATGALHVLKR